MKNILGGLLCLFITSFCFAGDNLMYAVTRPLPMSFMKADRAARFERELNRIKSLLPHVNTVAVLLDRHNSNNHDWVTLLDVCDKTGMKAVVVFAEYDSNRNEILYRPVFENND